MQERDPNGCVLCVPRAVAIFSSPAEALRALLRKLKFWVEAKSTLKFRFYFLISSQLSKNYTQIVVCRGVVGVEAYRIPEVFLCFREPF